MFLDDVEVQGDGELIVNSDLETGDGDGDGYRDLAGSTSSNNTLPATDCQTGSGFLSSCFKHSAQEAAWVAIGGDFDQTGGRFSVNNTMVLQQTDNIFEANGGLLQWTPPTHGPFQALAIWSETDPRDSSASPGQYSMAGSGDLDLKGSFFMPYAELELSGGSGLEPDEAQFVSRKLKVSGGGSLELVPSGLKLIEIPPPAAVLIR
ncbi:MAG: hypothetical protein U5R31_00910 [Acidimicrobiia bacterium]|nr:hypothetical protein [Acidimicrobiia bacterium]